MTRDINFFIAGSKRLTSQRDAIISRLMYISTHYPRYKFNVFTYENLESAIVEGGQQNVYNHFIATQADFVIFIIDGEVGGITKEEFDVALDVYKQTRKLKILVFNKNIQSQTTDNKPGNHIQEIYNKMEQYQQYYIDYSTNDVLPHIVAEKITPEINSWIKRNRKKRILIWTIIVLICTMVIGVLFWDNHQSTPNESIAVAYDKIEPSTSNENIAVSYDRIEPYSEGLAVVEKDGKYGYIDKRHRIAIPIVYDKVWKFREGLATVKLDGKWSYLNKKGKVMFTVDYDEAFAFYEGYAAVKSNKKYGFINKQGEIAVPIKYDNLGRISEGFAGVQQDGKWGFIDNQGRQVIPFKYEDACRFEQGKAKVKLNEEWFYIDPSGNRLN